MSHLDDNGILRPDIVVTQLRYPMAEDHEYLTPVFTLIHTLFLPVLSFEVSH